VWSEELQELSRLYLVDGVRVKSTNGDFGVLSVVCDTHTIKLLKRGKGETPLQFKSVDDMINSGWAID